MDKFTNSTWKRPLIWTSSINIVNWKTSKRIPIISMPESITSQDRFLSFWQFSKSQWFNDYLFVSNKMIICYQLYFSYSQLKTYLLKNLKSFSKTTVSILFSNCNYFALILILITEWFLYVLNNLNFIRIIFMLFYMIRMFS